jgi:hypothetical protein
MCILCAPSLRGRAQRRQIPVEPLHTRDNLPSVNGNQLDYPSSAQERNP